MPIRINTNAGTAGTIGLGQGNRIQRIVDVADAVGDAALEELVLLKLVERACAARQAARMRAKYGAESARAIAVEQRVQQIEQTVVAIEANRERFTAPAPVASANAYAYRGRVVDDSGLGVADRVVRAQAPTGETIVATTTDAEGNFTLVFDVVEQAPAEAATMLAQDPAKVAGAQIARAELEAGEVVFQVQVLDEGGASLDEAVTRVVESGTVDVGELVIDQPAAKQFDFDVRTRYRFGTR